MQACQPRAFACSNRSQHEERQKNPTTDPVAGAGRASRNGSSHASPTRSSPVSAGEGVQWQHIAHRKYLQEPLPSEIFAAQLQSLCTAPDVGLPCQKEQKHVATRLSREGRPVGIEAVVELLRKLLAVFPRRNIPQ